MTKHQQLNHQWYLKNKEKSLMRTKEYRKTKIGRLAYQKASRKACYKRRRNMNCILLFENPLGDSEIVDWHHVTDAYVVALPRDLHQLYGGKQHRKMMITIVKQIYGGIKL